MIKKSLSGFEYEPIVFQDGISEVNLRDLFTKSYDEQPWLVEACNCIYLITNLVNGKVYVGQAKYFYQRFVTGGILSHIYEISYPNVGIHGSIRKHGSRNFKVEILAIDISDLNELEIDYIAKFKSCTLDTKLYGYNLNYGGTDRSHLWTEESFLKSQESRAAEYNGDCMGACHTQEVRSRAGYSSGITQLFTSMEIKINNIRSSGESITLESYFKQFGTNYCLFRHIKSIFAKINDMMYDYRWILEYIKLFSDIYEYCFHQWPEWTIENLSPENPFSKHSAILQS